MKQCLAVMTLMMLVLGFLTPLASADTGAFLSSTRDKAVRGVENGLFGLGGELYHHIDARSEKGVAEAWTLGLWDGLNRGLVRTLVGAYELATPFYHDEPVLSDLDTLVGS